MTYIKRHITEIDTRRINTYIKESIDLYKEVSLYYKCDVFIFYSIKNGKEKFEFSTVILNNDMCDIEIKRSFKCNYLINILNNEKLEYMSECDISIIKNKYNKPNGIDILSIINIKEHIDYINSYYNEVLETNNKNEINIKNFLDNIKNEGVEWSDDYKAGSLSKNGLVYIFNISDGHIHSEIIVDDNIQCDYELFKQISDNNLNKTMESNNKIKELENYLDDMDNLIDTGWFENESIKYWAYYHNDMTLREFVSKGREYIRQYLMEEKGMKDAI